MPRVKEAMKNDTMIDALLAIAGGPNYIERQERSGTLAAAATKNLPKPDSKTKAAYEALGFVFGEDVDDLFVKVTMPAGLPPRLSFRT